MGDKAEEEIQVLPTGLKRGRSYKRTHVGINEFGHQCWGKILTLKVSVTVDYKRTWLTIGEFCSRCGKVAVHEQFQKGLPDMKKLREIIAKRKEKT